MKSIFLLLDGDLIVDICECKTAPQNYVRLECESYPSDLMTCAYRFQDGKIVRDETLYAAYLDEQAAQSAEETEVDNEQ